MTTSDTAAIEQALQQGAFVRAERLARGRPHWLRSSCNRPKIAHTWTHKRTLSGTSMLGSTGSVEIHRSWSVVSAVSLTIFTVVVFGLLPAVIVWSSKANAPADIASSPTGVLTLEFLG